MQKGLKVVLVKKAISDCDKPASEFQKATQTFKSLQEPSHCHISIIPAQGVCAQTRAHVRAHDPYYGSRGGYSAHSTTVSTTILLAALLLQWATSLTC